MKAMTFGVLALAGLFLSGVVVTHMTTMNAGAMTHGRGMMQERGTTGGESRGRMSLVRHRYVMRNGIDPAYAGMSNPLESAGGVLESGERLYENSCASCHGASGKGDGEVGQALDPGPTDIAAFSKMPMASDEYLYWTIAEGGAPLGTAMPAFKHTLEEDEIWQIIIYLREGL